MTYDKQLEKSHIPWNKGKVGVYSEEVVQKISKGVKHWYSTHTHPFEGQHHTEKTKEKIRIKKVGKPSPRKGVKHNDKAKKKISSALKGRKMHPNTREALMRANIGNTYTVGISPVNKGKSMSEKQRQKICKKMLLYYEQGNHPGNYKGGISVSQYWNMKHCDFVNLHDYILERDNNTCQKCGKQRSTTNLIIHHIFPRNSKFNFETLNDEQYLLTLCRVCHPRIEKKTVDALERRYNPLERIWGWL